MSGCYATRHNGISPIILQLSRQNHRYTVFAYLSKVNHKKEHLLNARTCTDLFSIETLFLENNNIFI